MEIPPKSGGVRIGWLIAVAVAALVLYLVTKKDTSVPVETSPAAPSASAEPVVMPATEAVSSELGGRVLPGLLVIGLLGVAVASAVRFFVQPPRGPRP